MTSSAATSVALPPSSSSSATEVFSLDLTEPLCCVVQLRHQREGVVHQVVLDPAKMRDGLIRIGDWPGDEAHGWQLMTNICVLAVLGRAERAIDPNKGAYTQVTPKADAEARSWQNALQ